MRAGVRRILEVLSRRRLRGPGAGGVRAARSEVWADGACVVAGGLTFLAFSPWSQPAVAVASLAVLYRAVLRASPRRAFRRGWLFGAAGFGAGLWWIAESFQYRGIGIGPAAAVTALLVAVLALYPALFGWASARFLRASGPRSGSAPGPGPGVRPGAAEAAALWWFPGAWILFEWLRGTLFSGFTWLQVGYAGLESPLAAFAPLGGSYAVGLAVAVTAASLAMVGAARPRAAACAVAVSALLWAGGAGMAAFDTHARWTRPAGDPLQVLIVQGNVPQDEKWTTAGRRAALDRYARLTAEHPGADLVVWPETAIPYFAAGARPFLRAAGAAAERGGYVLLAGILSFDPASGNPWNSVVRLSSPRSADAPSFYHKRRLVPFSERIPFQTAWAPVARRLGFPEEGFASGGEGQDPLRAAGHGAAVSICYEITFGASTARGLGGAGLLVNVSNDAWFGDTAGPHQHLQMARMRALELGRWLVRATNTGLSALVTPRGAVAASAPPFEAAAFRAALPPLAGRTPYARWRDGPVLALAALLVVIGWWVRRAGRGRARPRAWPG